VVEIEVVLRNAGKAGEGEDGAGGQGAGAAALASATVVSGDSGCFRHRFNRADPAHKINSVEQAPTTCSRFSSSSERNRKRWPLNLHEGQPNWPYAESWFNPIPSGCSHQKNREAADQLYVVNSPRAASWRSTAKNLLITLIPVWKCNL
jgi:hypothetical protein